MGLAEACREVEKHIPLIATSVKEQVELSGVHYLGHGTGPDRWEWERYRNAVEHGLRFALKRLAEGPPPGQGVKGESDG